MPEDALIALILLPFSLMFTVFTVLAAHQCARHQSFQPKEKISHLILIVLVPFFGAVWWFEAAEKRKRLPGLGVPDGRRRAAPDPPSEKSV
ncbi:MAG: hypothetical protein VCA38_21660 [Roseibacillus sp.]|jgi:hypothetical protein